MRSRNGSFLVKKLFFASKLCKKRIFFLDGDLDANWIESMNSVMDDNKMLTLASNERIPLKPHMRLIFEIRDLRFATPATVSRAGILYISTDEGTQWKSLIESWLLKLRVEDEGNKTKLKDCFTNYVEATLKWMSKTVAPVVSLQDMNFVQTLLYMLDGTLNETIFNSPQNDAVEKAFVFAFIWAMGSALTLTDDGNKLLFKILLLCILFLSFCTKLSKNLAFISFLLPPLNFPPL